MLNTNLFFWNPLHWWWVPVAALFLDVILGDPRALPHPVQAIGWLLKKLEPVVLGSRRKKLAGALAVVVVCLICAAVVSITISLPYYIGTAFAVYWSWSGLALGSLVRECGRALLTVQSGIIEDARKSVGQLVSRDVSALDQNDLRKTLAETISENLNDGCIAPFCFLLLGGPVGLWLYKAVSTMDSSWGYKNERWLEAGWASARLDDILAFIPARISAGILFLSGSFIRNGAVLWPGWTVVAMQARLMESPNAGWPMAAAAWLHGAAMGGPAVYDGVLKQKPKLGPLQGGWTLEKTRLLIIHVGVAGFAGCVALWCAVEGVLALFY